MKLNPRSALYWTLFAAETTGMLFILVIGLPSYRLLQAGPGGDRPGRALILPVLGTVIVMQACYWTMRRLRPPAPRRQSSVLGHLLLYFSRLSFIFAGSFLSLMLLTRLSDTSLSALGILTIVLATFAQFCYVVEIEALARTVDRGVGPGRQVEPEPR